jgi:hypothetical protein
MEPAPWNQLVDDLAWAVSQMTTIGGEPSRIQRRSDKCTESLRELAKNVDDGLYRDIVKCFADATRTERGYICIGPILKRRKVMSRSSNEKP